MSWMDEIGGLVQQYAAGSQQAAPAGQVEQHYHSVAQYAPCSTVANGLAEAFRTADEHIG